MPEIRMRPKHQVTLPASIVREANIQLDDRLTVSLVNGSIVITPKINDNRRDDVMAYAGLFRGAWGETPQAVEQSMHELRAEWKR
jgi:antitoxin component of MazEF toxin-antitoxin module